MGVVLLRGSSTTAWESFSGSVLQTGGWNTLSAQVAGGSGVLRWRQAKKQLQRLPSGQQISHISGSSTCCFCFQTQTDPEELFLHYLDSVFRQKSCEKEQSLANNTKEAGGFGCALGLGACTPSHMSATGTTGTPGVFSWSWNVRTQTASQAITYGCYLIPIINKQSIIWKQEVWENL